MNEGIAQCVSISSDNATGVSLEDVLMFVTGSRREPPFGFATKLQVSLTSEQCLLLVNTCALIITFFSPLYHLLGFQRNSDFCSLKNCYGFGHI